MIVDPIISIPIFIIIAGIILGICIVIEKRFPFLEILIFALLFLINLRIMVPGKTTTTISNNLNVLFVVDNTISMDAIDFKIDGKKDTRMNGVISDVNYIVEKLSGASFSVVSFDNKCEVLTPYSVDSNITKESVLSLVRKRTSYAKGTNLNTSYDCMEEQLINSSDTKGYITVLFYITDGEITDNKSLNDFSELSQYIDYGYILGYGTKKGGYMIEKDSITEEEEYVEDPTTYDKAISYRDDDTLNTLNEELKTNGVIIRTSDTKQEEDLASSLEEINKIAKKGIETKDKSSMNDIYYIFAIPLLIVLFIYIIRFRGIDL